MKNVHRFIIFGLLGVFALFFLLPFYVMLVTSLKDMSEIRGGSLLALPAGLNFEAWGKAWSRPSPAPRCCATASAASACSPSSGTRWR